MADLLDLFKVGAVVAVLVGAAGGAIQAYLERAPRSPDSSRTPGAINPDVTQETIGATICAPGWTATIRPPKEYTDALKRQQLADWRYHDRDASHYELDHLIPLELGGHPTDQHNLWPEIWAGSCNASDKDRLEDRLRVLVCRGSITLADAQRAIVSDWQGAYRQFVDGRGC